MGGCGLEARGDEPDKKRSGEHARDKHQNHEPAESVRPPLVRLRQGRVEVAPGAGCHSWHTHTVGRAPRTVEGFKRVSSRSLTIQRDGLGDAKARVGSGLVEAAGQGLEP
jgi:hypothetical protein